MGAITHNGEVLQSLPANASQINFDKTGTNLNSTQVESAIKEVNTKVNTNANDIDQLKSGLNDVNSKLNSYIFVTRSSVVTSSVAVGSDVSILLNDVIAGVYLRPIPTGYNVIFAILDGVRPSTSWDCVPSIFYNKTWDRWDVHNSGSAADTCVAEFLVVAIKS